MIAIEDAQEFISQAIADLKYEQGPQELYDPMRYILALGGKRIRPSLTLLACNVFSENVKPAIPAAVALEIFHNFTLVHDDIMDCAALRRGEPTVHEKWNHNVAILSGDGMCIKAYEEISKTPVQFLKPVLDVFSKTALQVCEGQQFDMNYETVDKVAEAEYLKMIALKTSVLLAACMKIGAIIAGASEKDADLMYQFGINMGLAFQLQDDLLDAFGDEAVFGKEIGKDIVSNKKTFLLIKALELSNPQQQAVLSTWLKRKEFDKQEKVMAIKSIYTELGIEKLTKLKIDSYFNDSLAAFEKVDVALNRKSVLQSYIKKLQCRDY